VELVGSGDPTGCGEGFSFVRIPLKSTFNSKWIQDTIGNNTTGKISISQQQQAYKDQIMRIWDAQNASLSKTKVDEVERVEMARDREPTRKKVCTKVLVIKREIMRNGQLVIEEQVVDDPRVISEYLAQKKLEQMKMKMLSKHKKVIEEEPKSRKKRKDGEYTMPDAQSPITPLSIDMKMVQCTECGQHGHVRNTRQCPLYESRDDNDHYAGVEKSVKITIPKKSIVSDGQGRADISVPFIKLKIKTSVDEREKLLGRLSKGLEKILIELTKIQNSWPFQHPVDETIAPRYYEFIERPMDFDTIKKKILNNEYHNLDDFISDVTS